RTRVGRGVGTGPAEPDIGRDGENHEIVHHPGPALAGAGRYAAADQRAGDMEAERPVAECGTDDPAAGLAERRIDDKPYRLLRRLPALRGARGDIRDLSPRGQRVDHGHEDVDFD